MYTFKIILNVKAGKENLHGSILLEPDNGVGSHLAKVTSG